MDHHKKKSLFWILVVGIFLIIFLMWLPQFFQSVRQLSSAVTSPQTDQTILRSDEWKQKIEEVKKNFDSLLKQTETITNTANIGGVGSSGAPAAGDQNEKREDGTTPVSPKERCLQAAGKIQGRKDKNNELYDVCIFPDGSECETRMFGRGTCSKGQTNVAEDLLKK
jgi:putative hemolysin